MGGIMSITGPEGGPFTRVGTSIGDITAGLFTAIGVLAALRYRKETGVGQKVDVAMFDTQLAILENATARYAVSGEIPTPKGNRHPSITPFEPFKTKDAEIMIAVGNDAIWGRFCKATDLEDLKDDARFVSNPLRNDNYEILRPMIAEKIALKTVDEWIEIFNNNGVPNGPINTVDKVLNDPQILARDMVKEIEHPIAGKLKMPGVPIKMSETQGDIRFPAPILGQHTAEILNELLGIDEEALEELKKENIF
jgi:CoA:oxalate CoA-transferase